MMKQTHSGFVGTYFNKDAVLRLARAAKVIAWIVLGIYAVQFALMIGLNLSQMAQGLWVGRSFMDFFQTFLMIFRDLFIGGIFFLVLMGLAQILLVFLDIEDNTRRGARRENQ